MIHRRRSGVPAGAGTMRDCRPWLVTLFVVVLVAGPGRADAQPSPWRLEERTTGGWTFTPGGGLGIMWDSSVQTASHPVVEALFQKWVGLVSPRLEIDFNGRRGRMSAGYSGVLEKYWGSNNGYEQRARFGTSRVLSRRASVSADASWTSVPTTDRLAMVDGVIPYVNIRADWANASAALHARATPRTSIDATYRFERITLDRPPGLTEPGMLQDGYSHTPSVQVSRTVTERLSIGAAAEWRRERVGGEMQAFDIQSTTGLLSYRWSEVTSIYGGGGASRVEIIDSGASTIGPTFFAGVDHRRRRFRLTMRYAHAFQPLFGLGTLTQNDTVSTDILIPIVVDDHWYYVAAETAWNRTHPVDALGIGIDLSTRWGHVSAGRQIGDWVRAEAFVSFGRQGASGGNTNRTRVGLQFVTARPLRMQ